MIYLTHRPAPPLDQLVDWFWYYADGIPHHRLERVLPDGTFELVINLREEPRHVFDGGHRHPLNSLRRGWLSGTHAQYLVIDTAVNSAMIGVHFKPGGVAPFLGMPAGELAGSVLELDAVWGGASWDLRDALLEAGTPSRMFGLLERFLLRRAVAGFSRSSAVKYALGRFTEDSQMLTMRAVAGELALSEKHFIDLFRREVGLTPKRFCRIRRFQRVLQQVSARRGIEWADVACACGYYDQAHFSNDFKSFSGLNPSAYLTQRGESINFVPLPEEAR